MYQHILISTDGSELARKGLDHGLALAKAIGAKATIITVTEILLPYVVGGGEAGAFSNYNYQEYLDIQKDGAQRILASAKEEARRIGLEAETLCVEQSSPAQSIVETAGERRCDLIAMSSHGRRGVRRLMLGSVASEVLSLSEIAVLVVR